MVMDQKIVERFVQKHPEDCLRIMNNFDISEIIELLHSLPVELSSQLIMNMDPFKAVRCIERTDLKTAEEILENCSFITVVRIFRALDKKISQQLLDSLSREFAVMIRRAIKYSDQTVGAYMDPITYSLREDKTVGQAMEEVKEYKALVRSPVFVLSKDNKLLGYVDLKDLIINNPSKKISMIMDTHVPKILANMNIQTVLDDDTLYEGFMFLPVVDAQNTFLGIFRKGFVPSYGQDEKSESHQIQQAGVALRALFQIGLSSLVLNTSELFSNVKEK